MNKITYLLSTKSLTGFPQIMWGMDIDLSEFVELVSGVKDKDDKPVFDGVSVFPIRFGIAHELNRLRRDPTLRWYLPEYDGCLDLEQTYRSEINILQVLGFIINHRKDLHRVLAVIPSFVFVPERRKSLSLLDPLHDQITIYPFHAPRRGFGRVNIGGRMWREPRYPEFFRFPERLVRPYAGLMKEDFWNFSSPEVFWLVAANVYGYTGICLNISDFKEMYPDVWLHALKVWLPYIKKVQVSHKNVSDTFSEEVLRILGENSWRGTVVIDHVGKAKTLEELIEKAVKVREWARSRLE